CWNSAGALAVLLGSFFIIWSCTALAEGSGQQTNSDRAAIALEALSRLKGIDLEANPAVKAAVLKVLEEVRATPQFVEIVRDFKIKGQGAALLELALKSPNGSAGAEAMRLILEEQDFELLKTSLASTNA